MAVYWWRKSAEQGNPAAQNNMGAAYSNGWGNLTQNKETAIYWYKKAKVTITLASGKKQVINVTVQKTAVKTTKITGIASKATLKKGRS